MNANELRIGNYFKDNPGSVLTVFGVAQSDHGDIVWYDLEGGFYLDIEEAFGIPLTEDWLLKFGFRKEDENDFRLGECRIRFSYDEYKFWTNGENAQSIGQEIKYVHTLQNINHAIFGTELTIK